MISKIVKGGFSILFTLTAITYALDMDKVTKSGKVKPRRRWIINGINLIFNILSS